ncbi:hypothetical protein HDZ31DRAFT_70090 [Schizophyllum fasciatum]
MPAGETEPKELDFVAKARELLSQPSAHSYARLSVPPQPSVHHHVQRHGSVGMDIDFDPSAFDKRPLPELPEPSTQLALKAVEKEVQDQNPQDLVSEVHTEEDDTSSAAAAEKLALAKAKNDTFARLSDMRDAQETYMQKLFAYGKQPPLAVKCRGDGRKVVKVPNWHLVKLAYTTYDAALASILEVAGKDATDGITVESFKSQFPLTIAEPSEEDFDAWEAALEEKDKPVTRIGKKRKAPPSKGKDKGKGRDRKGRAGEEMAEEAEVRAEEQQEGEQDGDQQQMQMDVDEEDSGMEEEEEEED